MKKLLLLSMVLMLVVVAGCGRQYAKGEYIDPNTIILRSDKFVESDLKIIADRLADSLLASGVLGDKNPPAIIISKLKNSTDEHIDMQSLSEKIMVKLHKSGKVRLINVKMRGAVSKEYDYQESGLVDSATAVELGRQVGAKYLISGNISSIKQPVGRQKIVYYKATLEMTSLKTNIIKWMDDVEIKKKFRKKYTGS